MTQPVLYIIDDNAEMLAAISWVMGNNGIETETYERASEFLEAYEPGSPGCVLTDMRMPEIDGLSLRKHMHERDPEMPVVMITGEPSIKLAVDAMKQGFTDFVEKPVDNDELLSAIKRAFSVSLKRYKARQEAKRRGEVIARLTSREKDVFDLLVRGMTSKAIAAELDISQKTVETHRASIMAKTKAGSVADLISLNERSKVPFNEDGLRFASI